MEKVEEKVSYPSLKGGASSVQPAFSALRSGLICWFGGLTTPLSHRAHYPMGYMWPPFRARNIRAIQYCIGLYLNFSFIPALKRRGFLGTHFIKEREEVAIPQGGGDLSGGDHMITEFADMLLSGSSCIIERGLYLNFVVDHEPAKEVIT